MRFEHLMRTLGEGACKALAPSGPWPGYTPPPTVDRSEP